MLKFHSISERLGTAKGEKDLSDLLALIDKFYLDIDWENIPFNKEIISILFRNYKQASKIYPIEFDKFNKIKKHLKEIGIIK
ncbi:MAG: hypothetical protein J7K26_00325 [Candidatus Aenigmarchaeota archaeon]|nr:hypothetical protein [Candidatus Aenigmarchaeota archaeon]